MPRSSAGTAVEYLKRLPPERRALDDLPLEVIARAIASLPPEVLIARYEASRRRVAKRA